MDESDVEEPAKENTYEEDKSVLGRIKRFFKSAYKIIKSLVGLIFLLIVYTLLGAAIFMITEGTEEDGQKEGINNMRENVITILLNLSNEFGDSEDFKNKSRKILIEYEDTVRNTDYSSTGQQVWSFWGSMLFCGTIYTTIGSEDITTIENGNSHKHKSKYSIERDGEGEDMSLDEHGDGTRSEDSKDTGKHNWFW
ncbi:hypothetical protein KUTeg_005156 [Tegillarca granosa]|uniref:Uncharacterized protein n=1 Tax=Tegillarca granosa TaxID=220873 RepID=A0ABQ9FKW7_TEGGR|nr:hypothetical protein KUTeg_005156 [Tegillarca granosa]